MYTQKLFLWITKEIIYRPFHVGYAVVNREWIDSLLNHAFPQIQLIETGTLEDLFRIRGAKIAIPFNADEFIHGDPYRHKEEYSEDNIHIHSYKEQLKTPFVLFQNGAPEGIRLNGIEFSVRIDRFSQGEDFVYVPFTLSDEDFHEIAKEPQRAVERLRKIKELIRR